MKILTNLFVALLLFVVTVTASADSFSQGNVTVTDPWSRPTPPGVAMGVGYMTISNQGDTAITLKGATTAKATKVTIHESRMKEGMMTMRPLPDGLTIPAGETVRLEPHGYHLMLGGLSGPVVKDERIPMTLNFEVAEPMQIELHATSMDDSMDSHGMGHQ